MDDRKLLAMLTYKTISSSPSNVSKKYSNTFRIKDSV